MVLKYKFSNITVDTKGLLKSTSCESEDHILRKRFSPKTLSSHFGARPLAISVTSKINSGGDGNENAQIFRRGLKYGDEMTIVIILG